MENASNISFLFGLAPNGVCLAIFVAKNAVRSYRAFSPLPPAVADGGLFSVALSIVFRRLGVTQRFALWSPDFPPIIFITGGCLACLLWLIIKNL